MKIKTTCSTCIFNTGEEDCKTGRLKKFRDLSLVSLDENGNNEINGACNLIRDNAWKERQSSVKVPLDILARSEVVRKTGVFIQFNSNHTVDDLTLIISDIKSQKLQPAYFVVCYEDIERNTKVKTILDLLFSEFEGSSTVWKLEVAQSITGYIRNTWDKYLGKYKDADFFALFLANDRISDSFCSDIDSSVNDKMIKFGAVSFGGDDVMVINSRIWNALDGDVTNSISFDEENNIVALYGGETTCFSFEQKLKLIEQKTGESWIKPLSLVSEKQSYLL